MSSKTAVVEAPLPAGLPGSAAGALAAALQAGLVRVAARLIAWEGPRVEVSSAGGAAKAAYHAALGLLELIGEEATLQLTVEAHPFPGAEASAAAAAAAAVASILGVAPGPWDLMKVLNTATAQAYGRPLPPHTAAALLGGVAVGAESPAFMARLPAEGVEEWHVAVIKPCKPLELPEVCVAGERYTQLAQLLAALTAELAGEGWRSELAQLLRAESPWDYASPSWLREARRQALEAGAYGAGLDPYTGAVVVVAPHDTAGEAVERVASAIAAGQGCKPKTVIARVEGRGLLPREEA